MPVRLTPSRYIHGSSAVEQERLSVLNGLINRSSLEQMRPGRGEKVLDAGCGLGQFSRMIAHATGETVVGIERDPEQILACRQLAGKEGEENRLDVRQGDVDRFPLAEGEWSSFDIVHARFLLEHLGDPGAAVASMVNAARPGGRIILEDDDHDLLRLWPEPEGAAELWRAYCRSFEILGNDPWIGRKLCSLLHDAGAEPRRATWLFFGACSGEPEFLLYVDNLIGLLEGARGHMLSEGLLTPVGFSQGVRSLQEWKKRPDAAFWYARAWAEGRKLV